MRRALKMASVQKEVSRFQFLHTEMAHKDYNPACVPARSSLLSGQHSRTCVGSRNNEMSKGNGIFGRDDRMKFRGPMIAEEFNKLGRKTDQIGKCM